MVKPAITTRFRCSSPLTDLTQPTLMFATLILQYLNKLVERKVGDFTSPQAFQVSVKVQSLNDNRIKLLTKFRRELPVKIFTLVGDFPIETCELPDTPPPTVRTFYFTRKFFVEIPKFVQGLFQRLWVLDFLTRAQCQVRVFHTEICPNAFTCCRQWFEICISCRDTKPIITTSVTFDCDIADSSGFPLAVFMESIWHFIKSPLTVTPLAKCKDNAIVFQRPPRVSRIGDRLKLVSLLDFRSPTEFLKNRSYALWIRFSSCWIA